MLPEDPWRIIGLERRSLKSQMALLQYGKHKFMCDRYGIAPLIPVGWNDSGGPPCTCGFTEILWGENVERDENFNRKPFHEEKNP